MAQNTGANMACPGKWKHGPKPVVCPSDRLILSHTHLGGSNLRKHTHRGVSWTKTSRPCLWKDSDFRMETEGSTHRLRPMASVLPLLEGLKRRIVDGCMRFRACHGAPKALENGLEVANLWIHPCRILKKSTKRLRKKNQQGEEQGKNR